jgi:iron(III) transport system ATP-binding protein
MTVVASDLAASATREAGTGRLQLESLTKRFHGRTSMVTAVDRVDLDVQPGEFITLLGPSGCGKTTTLRMVAGFEDASGGRILLDGKDIDNLPPQRRPMAMVFQSYALFPHLTVAENIAYGLKLHHKRKDEIAAAMRMAVISIAAQGAALRRATVQSGRQAAQRDAGRDPPHPEDVRHHQHLRHPRPGRGDEHVRPDHGDEQGQG